MNSVLQCLSHTTDLAKFSRSSSAQTAAVDKGSSSSTKDQKIWSEFCKLIGQMWQAGSKSANPSDLKMALSSKYRMYSGSAQQDAQEFLRYLLDALHGALNIGGQKISLHVDDEMRFGLWWILHCFATLNLLLSHFSDLEKANVMWDWWDSQRSITAWTVFILENFLSGTRSAKIHSSKIYLLANWKAPSTAHIARKPASCTIRFGICRWVSNVALTRIVDCNFANAFQVPVPSTPNCKLDKCLEAFTVKDVLDGNEMPYCDYCKTMRKCIKGFTIQRFPKYLVIREFHTFACYSPLTFAFGSRCRFEKIFGAALYEAHQHRWLSYWAGHVTLLVRIHGQERPAAGLQAIRNLQSHG